ncbi:MAG: alpha-amylase family glycosyl hydrolase [Candidatus Faecousia sp.]|nr:alpha-amylase family glycosyl hydrolase [Clostridiales bacterium]MDY6180806.1 alpha-amylase family glycosyl hydrolase [Candidatus Faecousia sp.]
MKPRARGLLCLLLAAVLLAGCAPADQTQVPSTAPESSGAAVEFLEETAAEPQEAAKTEQALTQIRALGGSPQDNYRVWYEIFVYSFCDSDGDGIGDLKGVTGKLDYLQELGINGIWLMPIHPSPSYHKYNVSDYRAIDPAYGTMEDFRELLAQCGARNIRVIMDLVVNHTGSDHAWFTAACEYLRTLGDAEPNAQDCPYVDYYNFSREFHTGYTQVPGADWYYESRFSPDMPDLNLGSDAVRAEIRDIMAYWLGLGVSGFRVDAAKEFYSGQTDANIEVLSWLQQTLRELKEDAYLVAEVWDSFDQVTRYYESGITGIFNYPFGDSTGKIIKVIRGAGNAATVTTFATALEKADKAYLGANPDYIDAPFLSNHDVGRIAGFCGGDAAKTKLAGAMNLLMSGSAFVYYGEEIGMTGSGNDPSKRAPMYWNAARDSGTTQPPPECDLPESYPFGSYEEQRFDDDSIYNYYRQLIAIRQAIPAISHGRTTAETALNTGCVSAFRKTWGEESCIVLMNISPETSRADLSAYADWTLAASLSAEGTPITLEGTALVLPPYGTAVLLPVKD